MPGNFHWSAYQTDTMCQRVSQITGTAEVAPVCVHAHELMVVSGLPIIAGVALAATGLTVAVRRCGTGPLRDLVAVALTVGVSYQHAWHATNGLHGEVGWLVQDPHPGAPPAWDSESPAALQVAGLSGPQWLPGPQALWGR